MKILIIKTSSLGDIIHCFPVLSYLKNKFLKVEIDWVIESPFARLVESHPYVNRIFKVNFKDWRTSVFSNEVWQEVKKLSKQLREQEYDVVFDMQGNIKSAACTFFVKSRNKVGFGLKTVSEWPNTLFTNHRYNHPNGLNISEDYLYLAQRYYNDSMSFVESVVSLIITKDESEQLEKILSHPSLKQRKKVLVCSGSNWPNKQVRPEALVDFLKRLDENEPSSFLFAWGTEEENQVAKNLHKHFSNQSFVIDRLTLPLLQNLMGKVSLVVAMDSLPLHLASTTLTPTFSIFGASLASKYKPVGHRHTAIQGQCPYGKIFLKRCPKLRTCKTGSCIRDLSGKEIFASYLEVTHIDKAIQN